MRLTSRSLLQICGLATLAFAADAQAQYVVARPQPAYRIMRDPGVLPAFAPRGGIGTTPYLGNIKGLGAYSTNYDAPRRSASVRARQGRRIGGRAGR